MKEGIIEPEKDRETIMRIYRKIDLYGNLKVPLTTEEQVLIFCLAKSIREGKYKLERNVGE